MNEQNPKADIGAEIDAFFKALEGENVHVLLYYGSERGVFLVKRDRAPSTEYPMRGETVVYVDWDAGTDYAISVHRGKGVGVSMEDVELDKSIVGTRSEAIEEAKNVFEE